MRICVLMGGLLIGGSGPFVAPASGQERQPPLAPPGPERGLAAPGASSPTEALRLGELAVLQAAMGNPASIHLAQPLTDAINLSTRITYNEWMSRVNYIYYESDESGKRRKARMLHRVALWHKKRDRVLNDPNELDLLLGDAPNALLEQLSNARVSPSSLRQYGETIPGETIQRICFQFRAGGWPISLGRLTVRDDWPLPLRDAAFERERRDYRAAIDAALEENRRGKLTPDSFRGVQRAVASLRRKLQAAGPTLPRPDFALAKTFLDDLDNAVEPMRYPDVEKVLAGIDSYSGTTVGDLVLFMQRYRIRIAPATTPDEYESYHALYTALLQFRDVVVPAAGDSGRRHDVAVPVARPGADAAPRGRGAAEGGGRAEAPARPADRRPVQEEPSPSSGP